MVSQVNTDLEWFETLQNKFISKELELYDPKYLNTGGVFTQVYSNSRLTFSKDFSTKTAYDIK